MSVVIREQRAKDRALLREMLELVAACSSKEPLLACVDGMVERWWLEYARFARRTIVLVKRYDLELLAGTGTWAGHGVAQSDEHKVEWPGGVFVGNERSVASTAYKALHDKALPQLVDRLCAATVKHVVIADVPELGIREEGGANYVFITQPYLLVN